jgi:hypothetical protein
VVAPAAAACSKDEPQAKRARSTTTEADDAIKLSILSPAMPPGVRRGTAKLLRRYFADAILAPLESGGPAPDLGPLFTADTAARVGGGDRPALVSEGMPPASDGLKADAASAAITPLFDGDAVPFVVAQVDLRLRARGVQGAVVKVTHKGDLLLVPDGFNWKIGGYEIVATRDTPAGTTTTVAASQP